jgi:hypothetical protein
MMNTHACRAQENKSKAVANELSPKHSSGEYSFQFFDNRSEVIAQIKLQDMIKKNLQVKQTGQLQLLANNHYNQKQQLIQKTEKDAGLPDKLKSGIESLSGYSMDDVKAHDNYDKPAQPNAYAYAKGIDVHLALGQEKYLTHEAWHVVQQKQGSVLPTVQMMKSTVNINDDAGLDKEADEMGTKAFQLMRVANEQNSHSGVTHFARYSNHNCIQRCIDRFFPSTVIQRFLDPITDKEIDIDALSLIQVNHYIEMEREGKLHLSTPDFIKLYAKKLGIPVAELGKHHIEPNAQELDQKPTTPIAKMEQDELSRMIQAEKAGKLKLTTPQFIEMYQRNLDLHNKHNVVNIFLNRFPIIRVFIPVAQGRGHQSATMSLVERIRALGYSGKIQIIYQEGFSRLAEEKAKKIDNSAKLGLLIPGFDPKKSPNAVQEIQSLGLIVMSESQFAELQKKKDEIANHVQLGFTGAFDDGHEELREKAKTIPEQLGVDHFQQFQPLDWRPEDGHRGVRTIKTDDIKPSVALESSRLGYVYPDVKPQGMSDNDFFIYELSHNPNYKGEIEAVQRILDAPGGKMAVHSMAVYGVTTGVTSQQAVMAMIALVDGVMYAQDKAKMQKGVVIPFIGNLADPARYAGEENPHLQAEAIQKEDIQHFDAIRNEAGNRVKVVNVSADFKVAIGTIQSVRAGEVLIVQFPNKLPKKIFDFLFARTTLPNASEGANTVDKDRQRKGAYLRVGKSAGKPYPDREQVDPHGIAHGVDVNEQAARSTQISKLFDAAVYKRLKDNYQSNQFEYFLELCDLGLKVHLPTSTFFDQFGRNKKTITKVKDQRISLEGLHKTIGKKWINEMAQVNPPGSFVGEFIVETMNPESPLGRYFARVKLFSQTHDQVQMGIAEIEQMMSSNK